jgi:alpha-beta hydrolase superfamily lysophospholipase
MVRVEHGAVHLSSGRTLPTTTWHARRNPTALLLALHSYGDYRLAYAEIGPWLAERDVTVCALDQPGFGETAERGDWPGWRRLLHDVGEALVRLRPSDGQPTFILGESLGGGVAMAAMRLRGMVPPAGLVLVEPAVRKGVRLRLVWDLVFGGLALVRPRYSRRLVRGRHPQLTEAARRRLAEDPLVVRHIRADAYNGLLAIGDAASAAARQLAVPALLIYGRADGIIPARLFERATRDLALVVTTIRYPDAPHLVLQARGWEEVMADVLAWMQGGAPPLPGSPGILCRRGPRPLALAASAQVRSPGVPERNRESAPAA